MFGNMTKIVGQLQNLQQLLKDMTVEGTAGDGLVKVIMNGQQSILAVRFDPDRIFSLESEALGQMITEAYNQAQIESKEKAKEEVTKSTGLNLSSLPGIF
ncbi:YbaB/EbfC family nucleoid-associated protein [Desulfotomaculum defluvii]